MSHPLTPLLAAPLLAFALLGCGAAPERKPEPEADTLELAEGASLELLEGGGLRLVVDGHVTLETAALPFVAVDAEDSVEASLGMWRFTRGAEALRPYRRAAATVSGGVATLRFVNEVDDSEAILTVETAGGRTRFSLSPAAPADALRLQLACGPEASFYGWGAQTTGGDQRGEAFRLFVSEQGIGRDGSSWAFSGDSHTAYFPMAWFLDARGWGLLLDTEQRVEVDLCAADPDEARLEVVSGEPLRFSVMHGPTPKAALGQLAAVVGTPAPPPPWAWGLWLCTQGGVEAVLERVATLEAAGVEATVLWVQDWTGRRENPGGGYGVQYRWEPDEVELYPGIADFIAGLHGRGYKVVGYINPFADPALQHWPDLVAGGMLPLREDGEVYTFVGPRGAMSQVDLSDPAARAYIEERLERAVRELGLDGWMTDFSEWAPIDAVVDGGDAVAVHNRSPQLWQALSRGVLERLRPDGDYLMFARAGWAGVQGSAQITWVGDQEADWLPTDGLPTVVPAMLNLGMSGQGYVTHDIAGFSGGPSTPELYARWTELGALSPFMRTHDGNERDENHRWDADPETTAHFARMVRLHSALQPELLALSAEFLRSGAPILRHLMLEYPEDDVLRAIDDQYLIGAELLVAPVLTEGARARAVVLPPGTWVNVWTGEAAEGPAELQVAAPIGQPPLFSRGVDRPDLRAAAEG